MLPSGEGTHQITQTSAVDTLKLRHLLWKHPCLKLCLMLQCSRPVCDVELCSALCVLLSLSPHVNVSSVHLLFLNSCGFSCESCCTCQHCVHRHVSFLA